MKKRTLFLAMTALMITMTSGGSLTCLLYTSDAADE